jgi:hypothetical protein
MLPFHLMPDQDAVGPDLEKFGASTLLAGHFHLQGLCLARQHIQKREQGPPALKPVTCLISRATYERQNPHPGP